MTSAVGLSGKSVFSYLETFYLIANVTAVFIGSWKLSEKKKEENED